MAGEIKKLTHYFFTAGQPQYSFDQIVAAIVWISGVDKEIHQNCGNMTSIMCGRAMV